MEPAPHRFFFPCHCDTPAWATPCPCGTPDIGNRDRGAPSQEGRRPAAIPSDQAGIRRHCRQCRTQRQEQGRVHTPAIDVDNRTPTMGKECSAPRKRGQSPESRTFIPPPIPRHWSCRCGSPPPFQRLPFATSGTSSAPVHNCCSQDRHASVESTSTPGSCPCRLSMRSPANLEGELHLTEGIAAEAFQIGVLLAADPVMQWERMPQARCPEARAQTDDDR